MSSAGKKVLILFDVDGTLTVSRGSITSDMEQLLVELKKKVSVGLVGGSNLDKIAEQMTALDAECGNSVNGNCQQQQSSQVERLLKKYDYVFAENGLVAYQRGELIGKKSIVSELGEDKVQQLINFCLAYMSKIELPRKRGTFVEFRDGMINVCPIGRSCTREERNEFAELDARTGIRLKMVEALKAHFDPLGFNLQFAIGGQISVDCFPRGWDKTFCLQYVERDFDEIHFFGDRTQPGGNDHEIFADPRTVGHTVKDPDDTKRLLTELFLQPQQS